MDLLGDSGKHVILHLGCSSYLRPGPGGQEDGEGEGDDEKRAFYSENARKTSRFRIDYMSSSMVSFDILGGIHKVSKPKA